ncbi:AI-2E family transporter, partial [bacterium]|nr:AI-2E family transporter [bacterium]
MGKITGLSPAVILLSLSIWGKLLGFLGLLLAIPITALLWATYNDFLVKPAKLKNARERRRKPLHARRPKKPN